MGAILIKLGYPANGEMGEEEGETHLHLDTWLTVKWGRDGGNFNKAWIPG